MRYLLLLLSCITICFTSCKENSEKGTTTAVMAPVQSALPAASEAYIYELFQKVDHIDYMFRGTNFSISQDEKQATQAMISTLSPHKPKMHNDSCRSPLRMTYLSNGEILIETEMYMSQDCQYVEFVKDGKPLFRNSHSREGYNFILNLMNQAANVPRNQ